MNILYYKTMWTIYDFYYVKKLGNGELRQKKRFSTSVIYLKDIH